MFVNNILHSLLQSFENFGDRNSFCIAEQYYSYCDFSKHISKIRISLQNSNSKCTHIGLVANDDIETYASIFAIWLEGLTYVPLHPLQPLERNLEIISQADIELIISSTDGSVFVNTEVIESSKLEFTKLLLTPTLTADDELAYILFTSGSTGKPKGVMLSRANISSFVTAFWDIGYEIDHNDRCLQSFDLTFDLSVMSYLIPLLKGACVYTVPHNQIRYSYVAELLEEHNLTVALMVPSTIRFLKPYFSEIDLPHLRYSMFCGEALAEDLTEAWSNCIPNAIIDNVYGPTEDTIFCSIYRYGRNQRNKTHNGVLSIGKSMTSGEMIVVDEKNNELAIGEQGELCLSGGQLTPGYWKNPEKNSEVFFINSSNNRFYRTGDICYKDIEGDFMYVGRIDNQVKVQGFRIELGEIEFYAREFLKTQNAVAIAFDNSTGNTEIALFVEGNFDEWKTLLNYLNEKLPHYMIPTKLLTQNIFPLNVNGKIDRKVIKTYI